MSFLKYISLLLFMASCTPQATEMTAMTFNIRWASPEDGPNLWANRRDLVLATLQEQGPDLLGLQEVTHGQLTDLISGLPAYAYCGVGRDDGKEAGEYSPLFYKEERFELLRNETLWLSETPAQVGSVGWDAALPRIATWAELRDLKTGDTLFVCNTHFDHIGQMARAGSARLLLDLLSAQPLRRRCLLMGDFNATPSDKPYRILADDLRDARDLSASSPSGPPRTFNGWGKEAGETVIDHIFLSGGWEVQRYEVLEVRQDSLYVSDHWPVVIRCSSGL